MSKHKTAKERRARRRIQKNAERSQRKAAGVEIISQSVQQIGGVTVRLTIGRIKKTGEGQ